ncbi:hypothetical protein N7539_007687 [Penicillium diatomitis]|uniref:Uncharacterized protein n=1 Tax=Penicillium diatomitis TaxID=2819901 RepID=A0A9X0BJQ6_9EURO|nr:uncharacterized protein N7539_009352 [Penicillium diatomitis]XP_056787153.1 uncharacterized protein N7539_007687 [Penicillium diatomitis]KAJ5469734.1 hypothetical protein N7539_009352 [Penicillium diatomitis]KAJ5475400.1 hypothetical protein N7539_007687 [Penicillium diatomitis]
MTSPASLLSSPFEETCISPAVTVGEAQGFFEKHGIFYAPDAEIGSLVAKLGSEAVHGKIRMERFPIRDTRLRAIIEQFTPSFCFTLGPDPCSFYASTITENPNHRAVVYMWGRRTQCEFSERSHVGELKGTLASNGLVQVPYSWLKKRNLQDKSIKLEDGGM